MTEAELRKIIQDELDAYILEGYHGFGDKVFSLYSKDILFRDFALHLAFGAYSIAARSSK